MKQHYVSMKDEVEYERQFYSEELKKSDWEFLKEASEMFLIHAYSHRFEISPVVYKLRERYGPSVPELELFGGKEYTIRYAQFNLNLAIGLELLFKSILLKKDIKINRRLRRDINDAIDPKHTISFGYIIKEHLNSVFPRLCNTTVREIKDTLKLINNRRNNIAHCSKKSYDSYSHEYRFSYITLYIYEKYFYGENSELTELLLKSLDRSKVTQQSVDFKPLKIKPRSLGKIDSA